MAIPAREDSFVKPTSLWLKNNIIFEQMKSPIKLLEIYDIIKHISRLKYSLLTISYKIRIIVLSIPFLLVIIELAYKNMRMVTLKSNNNYLQVSL